MIDGTIVTTYLVDSNRDYAQVLEERDSSGNLLVRYVYGHDLISQTRSGVTTYYHYDGLGSTRALTASSEAVTDTYNYDAFGNLLDKTGTTTNTHLFTGEFFDSHSGFYYLRARYLNPAIGRFITMDSFAGRNRDPYSLHKYLYAHASPVNCTDPTGQMTDLNQMTITAGIIGALSGIHVYHVTHAPEDRDALGYVTWGAGGALIGGILAHGAFYIWLTPTMGAVGETAAGLTGLLQNQMYKTAIQQMFNSNMSKLARELTKHPNIAGYKTFDELKKVYRTDQALHELAKQLLKYIMRNGRVVENLNHPRWGHIKDFILPDGKGARFSVTTKEFLHWLGRNQ